MLQPDSIDSIPSIGKKKILPLLRHLIRLGPSRYKKGRTISSVRIRPTRSFIGKKGSAVAPVRFGSLSTKNPLLLYSNSVQFRSIRSDSILYRQQTSFRCCFNPIPPSICKTGSAAAKFNPIRSSDVNKRFLLYSARFSPIRSSRGKEGCAAAPVKNRSDFAHFGPQSAKKAPPLLCFNPNRCDLVLYRQKKSLLCCGFNPIQSDLVLCRQKRPRPCPRGEPTSDSGQSGGGRAGSRYGARWLVVVCLLHLHVEGGVLTGESFVSG